MQGREIPVSYVHMVATRRNTNQPFSTCCSPILEENCSLLLQCVHPGETSAPVYTCNLRYRSFKNFIHLTRKCVYCNFSSLFSVCFVWARLHNNKKSLDVPHCKDAGKVKFQVDSVLQQLRRWELVFFVSSVKQNKIRNLINRSRSRLVNETPLIQSSNNNQRCLICFRMLQ